jgi:hypothetical protein
MSKPAMPETTDWICIGRCTQPKNNLSDRTGIKYMACCRLFGHVIKLASLAFRSRQASDRPMLSIVAAGCRSAFQFAALLCNRLISNCSGLICPWPGKACSGSALASRIHLRTMKIEVPGRPRNCDATRSFTSLTASR